MISGGIARYSPADHGLPRSRPGDLADGDRAAADPFQRWTRASWQRTKLEVPA
ncbi:hypothetical protein SUDANB176_06678 [Streptomyces sp. enrichment culture]|uniref:hypothetical protein n=1 Tax=Streptomyces sp. enrichment culture TaxID=1795815 RepID=UPI003F578135